MRSRPCSLPAVCRIDRLHAGMSRAEADASALDIPSKCCYFIDKAAAACAAPALKLFCSILHHDSAFTQNLGLTLLIPSLITCFFLMINSPYTTTSNTASRFPTLKHLKMLQKPTRRVRTVVQLAPPVGLEPTTLRLTAACSTD